VEGGSEGRGGGGVLMDRGEGVRGTQCYLVHLSIIENSIFVTIFMKCEISNGFYLSPTCAALGDKNDQHRPERRATSTHIAQRQRVSHMSLESITDAPECNKINLVPFTHQKYKTFETTFDLSSTHTHRLHTRPYQHLSSCQSYVFVKQRRLGSPICFG
jgi:hypothetical protein